MTTSCQGGSGRAAHAAADYAPSQIEGSRGAVIGHVEPGSPADDAGIEAGMVVESAEGRPLNDIIDWFWASDGFEVELVVIDHEGDRNEVVLEREPGEQWGIDFSGNVFDGVRTCVNACTFCFMAMLPEGMRPSMSLRDDDYRLSFLQGNFVTLTNVEDDEVERIVSLGLSPLHLSLHAVDAVARASLMGRNHARGLEVAERLLDAGIELHAQVVLVPGVNDGSVLDETLRWALEREGVLSIGVVPLGFTRFQGRFKASFGDRDAALAVIEQVRPLQEESRRRFGKTTIQLADEFYVNAFPGDVERHLPKADEYDGYPQFFDGIGMLRSLVDEWHELALPDDDVPPSGGERHAGRPVAIVCGRALEGVLRRMLGSSGAEGVEVLAVDNSFFGGNVDVTGLLTGADVARALACWKAASGPGEAPVAILPAAMLNDDGLTLDDMTAFEVARESGCGIRVVCYSAKEILEALSALGCIGSRDC